MSIDTKYQIKVMISSEKAAEIEKFLNEALPENSPTERKTIVVYEHVRNLGPACAGRYDKDVEEILQEAATAFPGASIEMQWSDEFGQEGSGSFYAAESMRQKMPSGDHKEEPEYIDVASARNHVDDWTSVDLSLATGIDDAAAAVFEGETCSGELDLSSITFLSDKAAESLSRYNGCLLLNGLTILSDAAAMSFCKNHEAGIFLDGFTQMPFTTAEILAKYQGPLYLAGITELTDEAAVALATHQNDLDLDGITELSPTAAEAFAKKPCCICGQDPAEWIESLQS